MAKFKKNAKVVFAATGEKGVIDEVIEKADGPWAEQFYTVKVEGNDLFSPTIQENALIAASEHPEWDPADYVDESGVPIEK